ncbi:MAG: hypothetical protein LBT39_00425 [Treponema sp.]|nr:hypothetical protein [Treponema sp.]
MRSSPPDNYVVRYQAEKPVFITEAGTPRFSPLRMGFQRIDSLFGSSNGGNLFSKSPFSLSAKIQDTNLRKNILLKLRI